MEAWGNWNTTQQEMAVRIMTEEEQDFWYHAVVAVVVFFLGMYLLANQCQ
jgi:hypothetical protein